jgi:hypothetical protein
MRAVRVSTVVTQAQTDEVETTRLLNEAGGEGHFNFSVGKQGILTCLEDMVSSFSFYVPYYPKCVRTVMHTFPLYKYCPKERTALTRTLILIKKKNQ